jgi:hypothetical protein
MADAVFITRSFRFLGYFLSESFFPTVYHIFKISEPFLWSKTKAAHMKKNSSGRDSDPDAAFGQSHCKFDTDALI